MTTKYERHAKQWGHCTKCVLHEQRISPVLARGKIPADILVIGNAPSVEDGILGEPFSDEAGHLLDRIFQQVDGTFCITHTTACYSAKPPSADQIRQCHDRIKELAKMVSPTLVVLIGALAARHYGESISDLLPEVHRVVLRHPRDVLGKQATRSSIHMFIATSIAHINSALQDFR